MVPFFLGLSPLALCTVTHAETQTDTQHWDRGVETSQSKQTNITVTMMMTMLKH